MRSASLRLFMMLWFGLLGAEPPMLADHCPVHDRIAGAAAAIAMTGHQSMQHAGAGRNHSRSHHSCSCRGMCCGVTAVALGTPPSVAIRLASVSTTLVTSANTPAAYTVARHTLPPATAPPQALFSGLVRS